MICSIEWKKRQELRSRLICYEDISLDLQSRNERMFLVTALFLNTAKTKQALDNAIFQTAGIAQKYNCVLKRLDYQQEEGLMSSVPLGVNHIPIKRWC